MKTFLAVLGAAMLAASPVSAAVVNYSMVFKDQTGANVGTGSFSFDPAVKMDIPVDAGTGGPCLPSSVDCIVVETWTPLISFFAMVGGQSFAGGPPNGGNFVEGTFTFDKALNILFQPGAWLVGDGDVPSLFIDFGSLSDQTAVRTFVASVLDPMGAIEISGTVDFTRLTPIPLPAGLALFGSGLAALGAIRRRKANDDRRTSLHGFAT